MITSAEEFVSLRQSENQEFYLQAATDSASNEVWLDVIARFPQMKRWVAQNKTVSLEILEVLAQDPDAEIRTAVAMKNKLSPQLYELSSRPGGFHPKPLTEPYVSLSAHTALTGQPLVSTPGSSGRTDCYRWRQPPLASNMPCPICAGIACISASPIAPTIR